MRTGLAPQTFTRHNSIQTILPRLNPRRALDYHECPPFIRQAESVQSGQKRAQHLEQNTISLAGRGVLHLWHHIVSGPSQTGTPSSTAFWYMSFISSLLGQSSVPMAYGFGSTYKGNSPRTAKNITGICRNTRGGYRRSLCRKPAPSRHCMNGRSTQKRHSSRTGTFRPLCTRNNSPCSQWLLSV